MEELKRQALDLIRKARELDCVITIELQPRKPLAMGNYEMVAGVRRARHLHPHPQQSAAVGQDTQFGWLIENGKKGDDLRYRTMEHGLIQWTADHMKAIRFCRRIDAEMFAEEDEDFVRIVEHGWQAARATAQPRMAVIGWVIKNRFIDTPEEAEIYPQAKPVYAPVQSAAQRGQIPEGWKSLPMFNYPHPHPEHKGKRIVGFVLNEDDCDRFDIPSSVIEKILQIPAAPLPGEDNEGH